jgi:hypothetical protein
MEGGVERVRHAHRRELPAGYERPRVERVLGSAELEREVLYAGDADSPLEADA